MSPLGAMSVRPNDGASLSVEIKHTVRYIPERPAEEKVPMSIYIALIATHVEPYLAVSPALVSGALLEVALEGDTLHYVGRGLLVHSWLSTPHRQ